MSWILLKLLRKLINALTSGQTPSQLGHGFAFGLFLGMPPFTFFGVLMFIPLLLLNINMTATFVTAGLCSLIAPLVYSLALTIGDYLLTGLDILTPVWTFLYNVPLIPLTHFNNTLMMGLIILSILLYYPVYFTTKYSVIYYQKNLHNRIINSSLFKAIKLSRFGHLIIKLWNATS